MKSDRFFYSTAAALNLVIMFVGFSAFYLSGHAHRTSRRLQSNLPLCTVSIGVATYEVQSDTLNSLLARADAALYRAKDLGRNRVETESAL